VKIQNWIALPLALSLAALLGFLAGFALKPGTVPTKPPGSAKEPDPSSNGIISPQSMADSLHFVIAAARESYWQEYLAHQTGGGSSSNDPARLKPGDSWPVPCEMFRQASESIQSKGAEFSYVLRSLHPIDPRNTPQTELEQRGLAYLTSHPAQNYYGEEMLGGRRYVTAVYPDLPAAAACVDCHNRQAAAPHHQAGEVLGGIVVRVPLEF
jgi:hypothetical protein